MSRVLSRQRPSLRATLGQMADVSRAIWLDYLDELRHHRAHRRFMRRYAYKPPRPAWTRDRLHLVVVAALVAVVAYGVLTFGGVR